MHTAIYVCFASKTMNVHSISVIRETCLRWSFLPCDLNVHMTTSTILPSAVNLYDSLSETTIVGNLVESELLGVGLGLTIGRLVAFAAQNISQDKKENCPLSSQTCTYSIQQYFWFILTSVILSTSLQSSRDVSQGLGEVC